MDSTFDKRKMGLDINVWIVMVIVLFLSLGLVGYRFINAEEPCTPPNITVNAIPIEKEDVHFIGEALTFKAESGGNKKVTWNFGDNTEIEEGFIATHIYRSEGGFTITTRVNGRCENIAKVNIKKPVAIHQDLSSYNISEDILGNNFPVVGKEEVYSYASNARSYEWSVKNSTNFPSQNGPTATFKFSFPGSYTIQLVLNNDPSTKGYKEITVINPLKSKDDGNQNKPLPQLVPKDLPPLPPPIKPKNSVKETDKPAEKEPDRKAEPQLEKQPEHVAVEAPKKKIINIQSELFQSKLEGVVAGQNNVNDFDAYLPDGGETHVLVNADTKYITFRELCERIKGQKKITIESVNLIRAEDNSIQQIKVKYKKKGFLGL